MDGTTLTQQQALDFVREYKRVISPRFGTEPKVYMYGSCSKGCANADSDIDVAVIVPREEVLNKWEQWADLFGNVRKVSVLIEPVITIITSPSPHRSGWWKLFI